MNDAAAKSENVIRRVGEYVDAKELLRPGESVLVALSGGVDSVCLLAILAALAGEESRGYHLTVAHLDHALRDSSPADAEFARSLAGRFELRCLWRRVDVASAGRRNKVSIETAARRQRYAFLKDAAEEVGASAVAMGHHAGDQVETVMFRLLRGAHLRGLAGIPASRELVEGVRVVRPLLELRREEIEEFCRFRGLAWRHDETNTDTRYARNYIRHELLGRLRERFAGVDESILGLADAAADAEALVGGISAEALNRCCLEADATRVVLDGGRLAALSKPLRRYVLRDVLEVLDAPMGDVSSQHLRALSGLVEPGSSGALALPGRLAARSERGEVIVERLLAPPSQAAASTLFCPGETLTPDGWRVVCEIVPFDSEAFGAHTHNRRRDVELLDADKVQPPLVWRPREEGDSFRPLGAPGRKNLGDFLTDAKLPPRRRGDIRCLCDAEGIAYVHPLRIAERVKVTDSTRRVLSVTVSPSDE